MAHYFDQNPDTAHKPGELAFRLHGRDFHFQTDSAVFSRNHLDFGTSLLIEAVIQDQKKLRGRLLDLGCGYGPAGIVLKALFPVVEMVMSDINGRAIELARQNARLNQVHYVDIIQSDGLQSVPGTFDLILTNPPIRAGKAVVYRLFEEAAARLRPGGLLYVVIRKQQGAPSALKYLSQLFGQANTIGHGAGYWILRAGPAHSPETGF
jgi:16S rRNA (guanine1207-N2)-methyltransferase